MLLTNRKKKTDKTSLSFFPLILSKIKTEHLMETLQQNTFKQLPAPIFTFSSLFSTNTAKVATFNKNVRKKTPAASSNCLSFCLLINLKWILLDIIYKLFFLFNSFTKSNWVRCVCVWLSHFSRTKWLRELFDRGRNEINYYKKISITIGARCSFGAAVPTWWNCREGELSLA